MHGLRTIFFVAMGDLCCPASLRERSTAAGAVDALISDYFNDIKMWGELLNASVHVSACVCMQTHAVGCISKFVF